MFHLIIKKFPKAKQLAFELIFIILNILEIKVILVIVKEMHFWLINLLITILRLVFIRMFHLITKKFATAKQLAFEPILTTPPILEIKLFLE